MERFFDSYEVNRELFYEYLRVGESFDIVERQITVGAERMSLFFIDGFLKDTAMQKTMQYFLSLKELPSAERFLQILPQTEAETTDSPHALAQSILSGQCGILAASFGAHAVTVDLRTYPARGVGEPESDRVMQGARDGFVETLIVNTALIRRRIRDPRLTMQHHNLGGASGTDLVICYMEGVADKKYVDSVVKKVRALKPRSLTLGTQSVAESLIGRGWFNPFPKIRTTERPDTAAAQVVEGSVLILCDTSPLVMILPTSLFDYLQQTDDYYFPPLTGTYLRLVRTAILLFSVISTPLWYLALEYPSVLPPPLLFLIPDQPGALPIIAQLFLAELAIDGLKIASMNTPDMLSNSLSVVGALILSDFAIGVGWFCEDVILYMAIVAIANFAQQNHELGYAFKFMRMMILGLTAAVGIAGFVLGIFLFFFFIVTNKTVDGRRYYLYPLLPWDGRAMKRLLMRTPKSDFFDRDTETADPHRTGRRT